jgi:non-ribosomal peptide synthase protein (TIGR01720 family)
LAGGDALGRALKVIKEQLRAIPNNGIGYGLLRYLNPRTATQLSGYASAQLVFNYLGRFVTSAEDWSGEGVLGGGDPAMPLTHALAINAFTRDDPHGPKLTAAWSWAPTLLTDELVRDLAERWFQVLGAIAHHTEQPGSGGHTPSDVALLDLSQTEIERLERMYAR